MPADHTAWTRGGGERSISRPFRDGTRGPAHARIREIAQGALAYWCSPVWNFHGDADQSVPVKVSRERIAARRKAGGKPVYTEYSRVGHNVARWAYREPALPEWLFAQRR